MKPSIVELEHLRKYSKDMKDKLEDLDDLVQRERE